MSKRAAPIEAVLHEFTSSLALFHQCLGVPAYPPPPVPGVLYDVHHDSFMRCVCSSRATRPPTGRPPPFILLLLLFQKIVLFLHKKHIRAAVRPHNAQRARTAREEPQQKTLDINKISWHARRCLALYLCACTNAYCRFCCCCYRRAVLCGLVFFITILFEYEDGR